MLARGIRSYHRPTRLDEALSLAAQGVVPVAGGTRLFASDREVANVLDLSALGLTRIETVDGDLRIGAMVTLQDVIDSPVAHAGTAGLLPAAARAHSASRMIRGMATVGGESVHGAHDSEVVAALLALNAIFEVALPAGPLESPALRFLRDPSEDLGQGGLLQMMMIPGVPEGAALERVAVLPSAPALVAVAVTISFAGEKCARARIALTGLRVRPARIPEAEARVEGSIGDAAALQRCLDQIAARAVFRDDAHASAGYRLEIALVLARRALERAIAQARGAPKAEGPRPRPPLPLRLPSELPYFTSGTVELWINGERRKAPAEARTTLMDLLRREGLRGVKHGCETGECGACTVLLDGRPVCSCLTLALRAEGRHVETVEGLGTPDALHPVQQAFVDTGAIQCGYCTPAMELCAKALLDAVPRPTENDVRDALAGCLCRCTGYVKPVQAVLQAAEGPRWRS
ncbi:MAG TPA: 2Fe-2S iron-sulfur cluster-binding protein [Vicinamibacteria bacterium]|nr:2Fe-2S iron-sulfur cluster-binding protein [Vicinamibacteria bacterium]